MEPHPPNINVTGSFSQTTLSTRLRSALQDLHNTKYPHIPNPPTCKKRASVALIIRIRPRFPHQALFDSSLCGAVGGSFEQRFNGFFAQAWVQGGDAEVLLIKRATRKGDRWTGHVALPGGKRETSDSDDCMTSVRETKEETGLDLDMDHCLLIGQLPQRVITTMWGETPLMVLSSFVYLCMRHDLPPLALQPTEVASAHWVSLRALLSPVLKTFERCDISERTNKPYSQLSQIALRAMLGQLLFRAVKLVPTESLYCSSVPSFIPASHASEPRIARIYSRIKQLWPEDHVMPVDSQQPLLLWGLTLSIIADLLSGVQDEDVSALWAWPTLSHWDIRSILWAVTRTFRLQKLRGSRLGVSTAKPDQVESLAHESIGLDIDTVTTSVRRSFKDLSSNAVNDLLHGYETLMRRAIIIALATRVSVGSLLLALALREYRQRQ